MEWGGETQKTQRTHRKWNWKGRPIIQLRWVIVLLALKWRCWYWFRCGRVFTLPYVLPINTATVGLQRQFVAPSITFIRLTLPALGHLIVVYLIGPISSAAVISDAPNYTLYFSTLTHRSVEWPHCRQCVSAWVTLRSHSGWRLGFYEC